MKATCRFNTVFLISSVKQGELNIARRLEESSLNEAAIRNQNLNVISMNFLSKEELLAELEKISAACPEALPLIHLDLHGNKDAFQCANGDLISWMEIGEKLRKINIACGLNLFVVVSACHGGYAAMATQLMSASPFFALCGPLEEVSAGDLLDDYERFYRELFLSRDCNLALDALNNGSQTTYLGVPARYLFNLGWSHYTEKLCSGKALRERVERVVQQALDGGIS